MLMAPRPATVAVLGIGSMGHGMATSALRAGIPTIVWNRRPDPTRDLADLGAEVADTAADAAARAGIVITMVTDADAVLSVATEQGMLDALAPGAIWAQMSTIGVAGTERVVQLVEARRTDGPLVSPWESAKLQRIARGDFTPQFPLALALKDVHLALEAVDAGRFESLASLAREWERAVDQGLGDQDLTVVTRALEDPGGT